MYWISWQLIPARILPLAMEMESVRSQLSWPRTKTSTTAVK